MVPHPASLDVTVRQAEYFVAAASAGTMTAAAEQLRVSQAAVSFAVGQLEQRLGVRLFQRRRGRPLQLTADGRRAISHAEDLLRAAQNLQEVADDQAEPRGTISVGWYAAVSPVLLPSVLDVLLGRHPGLDLVTSEELGDGLWEGLDAGTLDLVLAYELMVPERFTCETICEFVPHVLLPAGHHLVRQERVALRDLANEPAVVFDVPRSHQHLSELLGDVGVVPRIARTSKNLETVRSLVARGVGYTVAITPLVGGTSSEGLPIESRPFEDEVATTNLVVARSTPHSNARTVAFVEACRSAAREIFALDG